MSTDLAKLFMAVQREERRPFLGTVISATPLYVLPDSMEGSIGLGPLHFIRSRPSIGDKVIVLLMNDVLTVVGKGVADEIVLVRIDNGNDPAFGGSQHLPSAGFASLAYDPASGYSDPVLDTGVPDIGPAFSYTDPTYGPKTFQIFAGWSVLSQDDGDVVAPVMLDVADGGVHSGNTYTYAVSRRNNIWSAPVQIASPVAYSPTLPIFRRDAKPITPSDGVSGFAPSAWGTGSTRTLDQTYPYAFRMSDGWVIAISFGDYSILDITINRRNPSTGVWTTSTLFTVLDPNLELEWHQDGDVLFGLCRNGPSSNTRHLFRLAYTGGGAYTFTFISDPLLNVSAFTGAALLVMDNALHVRYNTHSVAAFDKVTLAKLYEKDISAMPGNNIYLARNPAMVFATRGESYWSIRRFASGAYLGWDLVVNWVPVCTPEGWSFVTLMIGPAKIAGNTGWWLYYNMDNSFVETRYIDEYPVP